MSTITMNRKQQTDLEFWTAQVAKTQAKLDELDRQRSAIFRQHTANEYRLLAAKAGTK